MGDADTKAIRQKKLMKMRINSILFSTVATPIILLVFFPVLKLDPAWWWWPLTWALGVGFWWQKEEKILARKRQAGLID
jgi:hypothetical protein